MKMKNNSVFTINEIKNSSSPEIVLRNNSTNEFISILPEFGARLKELWLNNGRKLISALKKVNRVDSENRDDIFTNAKLSPFAGRIKDGEYTFNNNKYNLFINYPEEQNACHGFIYNKKFNVIDKIVNNENALCRLGYMYQGENKGYPFSYSIEITYILSLSEGLTCTTKVINKSAVPIPISDGWHHYFDLGVKIDELELQLDVSEIIRFDSRNIPAGKKEPYKNFSLPSRIGNIEFDSCYKINSNGGRITTKLISKDNNIDLNIWQETGHNKFEYLVVYTPPGRRSIAVEPITSNINSFNNREGLIVLNPEENYISSFGIHLNKNQN